MKIALIGATGNIGSRILKEALNRGHEVTAIVRNPSKLAYNSPKLKIVQGDIFDSDQISGVVKNSDVVISAFGPGMSDTDKLVKATKALINAIKASGKLRLIAVGGAGSLEVGDGMLLVETPEFPSEWKAIAEAHKEALALYEKEIGLDWTNISPSAMIEPGNRTGIFRISTNKLLIDKNGTSRISMEDFAVAILNEVENPNFRKTRFTVGY
ncbi:NAD(P)-dependent oxidoreductase [Sporocytophaga myxococcoides]|uniref:NAD(P)-dependent oxidoreductase n=1 Tax=Sporocytophaga myxococcoides TaxID=153721 RepID=UPI00040E02E9|nr:NAD(P)-dependent oxidoreductase [Sporocytophaga myxococcoides]